MKKTVLFGILLCFGQTLAQNQWKVYDMGSPPDMIAEAGTNIDDIVSLIRFQCGNRATGYHADKDFGCEVFHYCNDYNMKFSYKCSEGRKFDEKTSTCTYNTIPSCGQKTILEEVPARSHSARPSSDFQPVDFFNAFSTDSQKLVPVSENEIKERGRSIDTSQVKRESNHFSSNEGIETLSAFAPLGKPLIRSQNSIVKDPPIERSFNAKPRNFDPHRGTPLPVHAPLSFNHNQQHNVVHEGNRHHNFHQTQHHPQSQPSNRHQQSKQQPELHSFPGHKQQPRHKPNKIFGDFFGKSEQEDPWRPRSRDEPFNDHFHGFPNFEEQYGPPDPFHNFNHDPYSSQHPSSHFSFTPPGSPRFHQNQNNPSIVHIDHSHFRTPPPHLQSPPVPRTHFSNSFGTTPFHVQNTFPQRNLNPTPPTNHVDRPAHFQGHTHPTHQTQSRPKPDHFVDQQHFTREPPSTPQITTPRIITTPIRTSPHPTVPSAPRRPTVRRPIVNQRRRKRPQQHRTPTTTTSTTPAPVLSNIHNDFGSETDFEYYDDFYGDDGSVLQEKHHPGANEGHSTTEASYLPSVKYSTEKPITVTVSERNHEDTNQVLSDSTSTKSPMEKFRELTSIHRPKDESEKENNGETVQRRRRPNKKSSKPEIVENLELSTSEHEEPEPKPVVPKKKKKPVVVTRKRPSLQEIRERLRKSRRNNQGNRLSESAPSENEKLPSVRPDTPAPSPKIEKERIIRPSRRRQRPIRRNRNGEPISAAVKKREPSPTETSQKAVSPVISEKQVVAIETTSDQMPRRSRQNAGKKRRRLANPNARARFREFLKKRKMEKETAVGDAAELPAEEPRPDEQPEKAKTSLDNVSEIIEPVSSSSEARFKRLSNDVEFKTLEEKENPKPLKPIPGKPFRYLLNRSRNSQVFRQRPENIGEQDDNMYVSPITSHTIVHPTDFKQVVEMSPRTPVSKSNDLHENLPLLSVSNYQIAPLYREDNHKEPAEQSRPEDVQKLPKPTKTKKNRTQKPTSENKSERAFSNHPDHHQPFFDLETIKHHSGERTKTYVRPPKRSRESLKVLDSHPFLQPNEAPRLPLEHLLSFT